MRENVNRLDGDGSHGRCTKCAVIFFHSKQALLGLFDHNFSYLIMPQRGLNPRQSVSRVEADKDLLRTLNKLSYSAAAALLKS